MKSVVTLKLKMRKNPALLQTMEVYSKAVAYIAEQGYTNKISNRYQLHHLCYYRAKQQFHLPSQFIINANRVASQTLRSVKKSKGRQPLFKAYLPLDFDKRTFTFSFDKVRLTTIEGRMDIPLDIPEYYWRYLDWSWQTAQVMMQHEQLFIHITFTRNIPSVANDGKTVGIDLGIRHLVVASDKRFFSSKQVKKKRIMFKRLKAKLQAKCTKSAKQLLRKISGREQRFIAWVNHNVSKEIISTAEPGDKIVLENLKGIRRKRLGKNINFWLHGWSFYQLQNFITYKATIKGIQVVKVNPCYTSQICSHCISLGSRTGNFFRCTQCGYSLNADLNASINLAKRGSMSDSVLVAVNQPYISGDDSKATRVSSYRTADELRDNVPSGTLSTLVLE
ncbi:MAG: transposase [Candidatus Woesearchaeota archaeon]|nr:transposase [Candidatus Woesearchaeota archaeon]